jgi:hypothetical protein
MMDPASGHVHPGEIRAQDGGLKADSWAMIRPLPCIILNDGLRWVSGCCAKPSSWRALIDGMKCCRHETFEDADVGVQQICVTRSIVVLVSVWLF